MYSPEKTIADCFKYRNKIVLDVAIEALRTYRERTRKPDYQALSRFCEGDASVPGGNVLSGHDLGASVRQRLLNQARSQGRPFQELLQYFAMERYCIAWRSHHSRIGSF